MSNYGNIKYRSSAYTDRNILEAINEDIRNSYGIAHNIRAGVEIKPIPAIAVRAGYNISTSAQKAVWDNFEEEYVKVRREMVQKASFGVGFSSNGSFFADIALTRTFVPREYFLPYEDYIFTTDNNGELVIDSNYFAPELLVKTALWKAVLTLGFRF